MTVPFLFAIFYEYLKERKDPIHRSALRILPVRTP